VVTLAIWWEVTPTATLTICGVWRDMADVITCAIFGDCRLRGVGVVRGVSLPSPIDLTRRRYNTSHSTLWLCDHEQNWTQDTGAVVQLVKHRTGNQEVAGSTHTRSIASNLEQVANLLFSQANSASYPQLHGKWVVATATGWRPSVADWCDGVSASCTVGPIVR